MDEPILDFHTHAQNVFGMCCVARPLRPLLRHGLGRLYEKTGFHPALKRLESPFSIRLIAREMQSRFASFAFADYLAAMRKNGVSHACALPVEPLARTEDLLRLVAGHPEVIPFASVDFEAGDVVAQLDGHLRAGCRGLKLHPIMQDVAPEDERLRALFERLRGTGVPVIFHTGRVHYFLGARREDSALGEPGRLTPLLRDFPEQPVVLGHAGLLSAAEAIGVAEAHRNAYLEVSFQPARVVAEALTRAGPDRVLLGSDWPATETRSEIRVLRRLLGGDRSVLRRVLFENGARLLRSAGARL